MKKILLLLIIATFSLNLSAQEPSRKEQIEAFKIAYMTEKLSLSAEDSQLFWPLYNEYEDAIHKVMRERRKVHKKINEQPSTISDVNAWLDAEGRIVEIRKSYVPKFLEVLSADQIAKMLAAEEGFKQELVRSLRRGGKLKD